MRSDQGRCSSRPFNGVAAGPRDPPPLPPRPLLFSEEALCHPIPDEGGPGRVWVLVRCVYRGISGASPWLSSSTFIHASALAARGDGLCRRKRRCFPRPPLSPLAGKHPLERTTHTKSRRGRWERSLFAGFCSLTKVRVQKMVQVPPPGTI